MKVGENIYLGYASFVNYINKKDYIVVSDDNLFVAFWRDGESSHSCELTIDKSYPNCGFVYINTKTLKDIFKDTDLTKDLLKFCIRPNLFFPLPVGKKDYHCNIDPSLWGKTKIEICIGETVKCLHPSPIALPQPSQGK